MNLRICDNCGAKSEDIHETDDKEPYFLDGAQLSFVNETFGPFDLCKSCLGAILTKLPRLGKRFQEEVDKS